MNFVFRYHRWRDFFYSGRKAARVKVSVALSNSFFHFLGRDGPRDKTSGHELLFSLSSFVLVRHELSFGRVIKFFKFLAAFFVVGP